MEKNDFKEICKCAGINNNIAIEYNSFKHALTKVKDSIDTRQFFDVYTDLSGDDAQLFTVLCWKCGINPFHFTNSVIPSRSLYRLNIPKGSYYEDCLLDCLYNLPKNTNIVWHSCDIEIAADIVFNNIANIDNYGLRINALYTEINGNEIFINNNGMIVYCPHLSINCKELHLKHNSISGSVGDLTLNVEDEIFMSEDTFSYLDVDILRISKWLYEKHGKTFFMDSIDCNEIIVF